MTAAVFETSLPGLLHRGKVRDTYDLGGGLLLMVATDRISAFDVIMPDPIPGKGIILTQMSDTGGSFTDALAEADSLGYTELDPSADIEGFDAAAKLAILASLAFNARVVAGDVAREGISHVSPEDIAARTDAPLIRKS